MIYVSQGHEKSVSLEVFLKTYLLLGKKFQKKIILYCFKDSLIDTLKTMNIVFKIQDSLVTFSQATLLCSFQTNRLLPQSTVCLESILDIIKKDDTLVTLPTSKDQLILNGELLHGHTEYFRKKFLNSNMSMCFISHNINLLLLTDHIPLKEVTHKIKEKLVEDKITNTLKGLKRINRNISEIIFSGINPHAGEDGILGTEDNIIKRYVEKNQTAKGPFSGDITHTYHRNINQLLVYAYHDQGLAYFKSQFSHAGINITFGLPFIRISVDHGTAFGLYGKNQANYFGSFYLFKWLEKELVHFENN